MFATIVIVLLAGAAVYGLLAARRMSRIVKEAQKKNGYYDGHEYSIAIHWILCGVASLVLVIVGLASTIYTQDPGEAKVIKNFGGQIAGSDTTPGIGFVAPWMDVINFDIRNRVVTYAGDGKDHTGPAISAQDKDGATAQIDVVVRYSIDPNSVVDIYKNYRDQESFETSVVQNDVRSILREIPLKYSTTTFRPNRSTAAAEMQKALSDRWNGKGIIVEAVDLRDIRYPDVIEKSLQAVQESVNNANKAKADLETAKVTAERTRVDAQAQADADLIVRCGARTIEVEEIINGANTKVSKTVPLQGGECQNRLNEQVLTSKYIETLKEMAGKGNVIVIPQGSTPMVQLPTPVKTN